MVERRREVARRWARPTMPETAPAPSLDSILAAARLIAPVLMPTPLLPARADALGALRLKPENLQRTGSFKIRGAYHKLSRSLEDARARGVVAYSSGNHGQAVACAASLLGCRATVVMPEGGVVEKRRGVEAYGGRVVLCQGGSDERRRIAEDMAHEEGLVLVPPYDDLDVITGQASVGLEIAQEFPAVRQVLVPVGGGGLLGGSALALKALVPGVRVVGVEPQGANDLWLSFARGEHVALAQVDTAADGLRTQSVGSLNYPILRQWVDDVVTVTEDEILSAVEALLWREKLLVEPSGAVAYAAFAAGKVSQDLPSAVVLSGGNIARDYLQRVVG